MSKMHFLLVLSFCLFLSQAIAQELSVEKKDDSGRQAAEKNADSKLVPQPAEKKTDSTDQTILERTTDSATDQQTAEKKTDTIADQQTIEKNKHEMEKGNQLYKSGKFADALTHFHNAAKTGVDDGQSMIMAGSCCYHLKQYSQALQEYNLAAKTAKSISIKNKAQTSSHTLECYMKGICPGNCLKPSMPGWRRMNVPGKPPNELWMAFPFRDASGKTRYHYWSNGHMGEVIEYVKGVPVNKGKCPICHGTTHVSLAK